MSKLARTGLCFVSVLLVQFSSFIAVHAIAQDDPAVDQIAQRAINAQNAGEFKIAGSQWEELISGYPNASQIGVAYYQSGYCFVQTGQFAKAADRLRQAIGKLDPKDIADPIGLSDKLKAAIAEGVGPFITCSIGFAANRHLAKIACKMDKPDGTTMMCP